MISQAYSMSGDIHGFSQPFNCLSTNENSANAWFYCTIVVFEPILGVDAHAPIEMDTVGFRFEL